MTAKDKKQDKTTFNIKHLHFAQKIRLFINTDYTTYCVFTVTAA